MATCMECTFFEPINEPDRGYCFGHVVFAKRPAAECPFKAFQPREGAPLFRTTRAPQDERVSTS